MIECTWLLARAASEVVIVEGPGVGAAARMGCTLPARKDDEAMVDTERVDPG